MTSSSSIFSNFFALEEACLAFDALAEKRATNCCSSGKLFRSYDLNNDQKMKVVETLDRTKNVREVKLVFSTLAESLKIGGTSRKTKQTAKLTESFASKVVASTAPSKEVITESTNTMADRFKQLANIK